MDEQFLFLASDAASYINGVELFADGGLTQFCRTHPQPDGPGACEAAGGANWRPTTRGNSASALNLGGGGKIDASWRVFSSS